MRRAQARQGKPWRAVGLSCAWGMKKGALIRGKEQAPKQ